MERSGVRFVVVGVAATIVAAVLAVFALRSVPSEPDLTESDYGGKMHLVVNHEARRLYALGASVEIDFATKPRVKIQHPVGLAEGTVRTEGRRLIVTFDRVDGLPAADWDMKWPALRSKLIAERVARAHRHPRPKDLDIALRKARNESEAISAFEREDYAASLMNPFGQEWEWEVPIAENWIPLNPLTPEFR